MSTKIRGGHDYQQSPPSYCIDINEIESIGASTQESHHLLSDQEMAADTQTAQQRDDDDDTIADSWARCLTTTAHSDSTIHAASIGLLILQFAVFGIQISMGRTINNTETLFSMSICSIPLILLSFRPRDLIFVRMALMFSVIIWLSLPQVVSWPESTICYRHSIDQDNLSNGHQSRD